VNVTKTGASGARDIRALMEHLRKAPLARIGAHEVRYKSDYQARTREDVRARTTSALTLPESNVLAFELEGGSRIIARPSGTEPKVKFYFDVRAEVREGEAIAAAEARAKETMTTLADAFVSASRAT
jgi:phosphomannomutase